MLRHLSFFVLCAALSGCSGCDDDAPACKGANCEPSPCDGGICQTAAVRGIPAEARACEALVEISAGISWSASFGSGVQGRAVAEGPRVAVAFIREGDEPFPADAVALDLQSGAADGLSIAVKKSACFSATGEEISDVALSFDR